MTVPFPGAGDNYDGNIGMEGGAPGDRNASLLAYRVLEPVGVALIQRIADALPLMSRLNALLPTVASVDLDALAGLSETLFNKVDTTTLTAYQVAQATALGTKLNASDYTPGNFAPIGIIAVVNTKLDAAAYNPAAFAPASLSAIVAGKLDAAAFDPAAFAPASITQYTNAMAVAAVGPIPAAYTNAQADARANARIAAASIDALLDVDTLTTAPTAGQALVWDQANLLWKPGSVAAGGAAPAATVPLSSTRWRLLVSANNGGVLTGFAELKLALAQGGANIATTGTASASSVYGGAYAAAYINDNDLTDRWLSGTADAQSAWIEIAFAATQEIKEASVIASTAEFTYMPKDYKIQAYVGGAWVDAATAANQINWGANEVRALPINATMAGPGAAGGGGTGLPHPSLLPHRYWALWFTGGNGYAVAVAELQLRATPGGANQCSGGVPIAFANNYAPMANAFDGNPNTAWIDNSYGVASPYLYQTYIGYDFGAGNTKVVQELAYSARDPAAGAGGEKQTPYVSQLMYSDDGITFYPAIDFAYSTSFALGEVRTAKNPLIGVGAGAAASGGGGGAFAGVTYNGATATTLAAFGGTLTKQSTGRFTFTFATPQPDANYYVIGTNGRSLAADATGASTIMVDVIERTTTYVKFNTAYTNGSVYDGENGSLLCFPSALSAAGAGAAGSPATTPTVKASNLGTYSSASIAVPLPGTPAVGDVAFVFAESGYTAPTYPAGWKLLYTGPVSGNYTNGVCVSKVLTADDIATGNCTITWLGAFDGTYACVIVDGTTMNGLRDVIADTTAGSGSATNVASKASTIVAATDLVIGFAAIRGANTPVGISNFAQLQAPVGIAQSSGFVGKYTGALGKLGFGETITAVAGNNGMTYVLVAIR